MADEPMVDLSEFKHEARLGVAGYQKSTVRENMLDHAFISEALQEAWFVRERPIQVMRSEVDAYGYDLAMRCGGVTRWIQLKSSTATRRQTVTRTLLELPRGMRDLSAARSFVSRESSGSDLCRLWRSARRAPPGSRRASRHQYGNEAGALEHHNYSRKPVRNHRERREPS